MCLQILTEVLLASMDKHKKVGLDIHISNYHNLYLKYLTNLFVNYTLIKLIFFY